MTIGGFGGLLHPSVMDESSIWRSSSEMTALILAAGTFCILASAAHCTSLFTVMARVRRQRTSAPQAEVGVSILRPLAESKISQRRRYARHFTSIIDVMRSSFVWLAGPIQLCPLLSA
jgi:hypothetical protein